MSEHDSDFDDDDKDAYNHGKRTIRDLDLDSDDYESEVEYCSDSEVENSSDTENENSSDEKVPAGHKITNVYPQAKGQDVHTDDEITKVYPNSKEPREVSEKESRTLILRARQNSNTPSRYL